VPYKIGEDSGCNSLIKEGAKLIETHEDVLNEL
jgi:predicted Rossmann fold nucleotide-binding protein DprA/Smf involved in DNA uptake